MSLGGGGGEIDVEFGVGGVDFFDWIRIAYAELCGIKLSQNGEKQMVIIGTSGLTPYCS